MLGEIRIYGIVLCDKVRRYSNFYVKNVRNLPLRYSPMQTISQLFAPDRWTKEDTTPAGRVNRSSW